jgi:hypothetical protein
MAAIRGAFFGYAGLGLVSVRDWRPTVSTAALGEPCRSSHSTRRSTQATPHSYDAVGESTIAEEWVRKAVREGIRLVEVNDWHPTLKRLAGHAGLITARNDHG